MRIIYLTPLWWRVFCTWTNCSNHFSSGDKNKNENKSHSKEYIDHFDGARFVSPAFMRNFTFHSITIDLGQHNNYGGAAVSGTWLNRNIFIFAEDVFGFFDFSRHLRNLLHIVLQFAVACGYIEIQVFYRTHSNMSITGKNNSPLSLNSWNLSLRSVSVSAVFKWLSKNSVGTFPLCGLW